MRHLLLIITSILLSSPAYAQSVLEQISNNEVARAQAEAAPMERNALADENRVVSVAVYSLETDGIPKGVAQLVTDNLLAEVRKLVGVSAIGMEEITQMISLEAQKQMMDCDEAESCLSQIAGSLGVDEIITGRLTEAADGRNMVIRRINQRRAKVVATSNQRLQPSNGEEFLAGLGKAVETIYGKRKVLPGQTRGVPEAMALRLSPPPIPTWATYAVGGAALFAGALGGGFGYAALHNQEQHNTVPADTSNLQSSDYARYANNTQTFQSVANGSYGTAATLLISAAVMALFTDWEGYQEALAAE